MLFRKKIPRSCAYCALGAKLGEDQILCAKRGIVAVDGKCRKFKYDPLKRIPTRMKPKDFARCDDLDYSL